MSETSSRRIPWLRILAEGGVIVVSVLLALAAQAWWDQREARIEERAILQGVEADFKATLSDISVKRSVTQSQAAAAQELISLSTHPDQVSAAAMDTLLAELIKGHKFVPTAVTLNVLFTTDGLDLISDRDLRSSIAGWPSLIAAYDENNKQGQELFNSQFLSYLRDVIPLRTLDAIASPEAGAQPSAFRTDARVLLNDLRFENGVADLLLFKSRELQHLDDLETHIERGLSLLDPDGSKP